MPKTQAAPSAIPAASPCIRRPDECYDLHLRDALLATANLPLRDDPRPIMERFVPDSPFIARITRTIVAARHTAEEATP